MKLVCNIRARGVGFLTDTVISGTVWHSATGKPLAIPLGNKKD
jgi:hypothetical protein